jgi:hypothetical protein
LVVLVSVPVMLVVVPLLAMPVRFVVLSLVQLNVVPATAFGLVTVTAPMAIPEQTVCEAGDALTVGAGFTTTCTVVDVEVQVPAVAVTVNVVVCCTLVILVNVPVILAAVPLLAMPVRFVVLSLFQLNVVPATAFGFVIVIVPIVEPEQTV